MQAELRVKGIDRVLETLRKLPPEVVSKRGGPVKLSLKKGANLLRAAALANLQRVTANADDEGRLHSTGLIAKNLVATRGKAPASGKGERYLVRVRRVSYPDRDGKARATTTENAARLEYGTEQQPAEPWIRPAFEQNAQRAIDVITTDLARRVDALASKYLRT